MKKLFLYISVVGLAAGVVYLLCKKDKNSSPKKEDKDVTFDSNPDEGNKAQTINLVNENYQTKSESTQAVHERHVEASRIMKEAYSDIMEEFVEDFSCKKNVDIIDNEAVSVVKEIDSISDELDDLLM